MDNNKITIVSTKSIHQSKSTNLDKSIISTNSYESLKLNEENYKLGNDFINEINNNNNLENDLKYRNDLNYKINPEHQKNTNNFMFRKIIPLFFLLVILFYFNHFYEKKNYLYLQDKTNSFSRDSCIIEFFPEVLYKATWKFFLVNKTLKNTFLTIIFYFNDLIFFFSCFLWIINSKKENWSFLFSLIIIGLSKYFALEFYLIRNQEDILWKIPNFPFFLTIQNSNRNENTFFSSSSTLLMIIIKQLEDNKFKKLKRITLIFLFLNILLSVFLKLQSIFGIIIGMLLGLYLNKISDEYSKVFNYIYNFNEGEEESNNNQAMITIDFEKKIKENIEKIIKNKKYIELNNLNERSEV